MQRMLASLLVGTKLVNVELSRWTNKPTSPAADINFHLMDQAMAIDPQSSELFSPAASDPIDVEFSLSIDTSIYPQEAVFRTCYAFTDRCYIWIKRVEGPTIAVCFARKDQSLDLDKLKGEFANALIDFALRDSIERQTRDIRATIVSAALAEASGGHPKSA